MEKVNLESSTFILKKGSEYHSLVIVIDSTKHNYGGISYFIGEDKQFQVQTNFSDEELKALAAATEIILLKAMSLARK